MYLFSLSIVDLSVAIPDVLVTLRFRLVVEILLWNCGLRLKVCSTFVPYLYFFSSSFSCFWISRSVWFRWISVLQTPRERIFHVSFVWSRIELSEIILLLILNFSWKTFHVSILARIGDCACLPRSSPNYPFATSQTRDSRSRLDRSRDFSFRSCCRIFQNVSRKILNRKKRAE